MNTQEIIKQHIKHNRKIETTPTHRTPAKMNFRRLVTFYKYLRETPIKQKWDKITIGKGVKYFEGSKISTLTIEEYQRAYKTLSENKQIRLSRRNKPFYNEVLTRTHSKTGKLHSDSSYTELRKISIVIKAQSDRRKQQEEAIKRVFSKEGILRDTFLLNSFVLFVENNGLYRRGKKIKPLLMKFIRAYDYINKSIDGNKLRKLFPNVDIYKCSDFFSSLFSDGYKTISREKSLFYDLPI